jgi:hypothetical protein
MALHLFQYAETEILALTHDRTGSNLPKGQGGEWRFRETLDPLQFAFGERNFGEARASLDANGFYLFEGETVAAEEADYMSLRLLK